MSGKRRFALHYLEMVVAMLVGMVALGYPADALLRGIGLDPSRTGLMLAEMGATMTVGMVAWMRIRGHRWQPCLEMAASMVVPTAGAILLLVAGLAHSGGTLMLVEHAVMLPSMLVAMLLRASEYTGHAHHHRQAYA